MEKDNARKALGLPIMSELTNEELNKELEIAVDNTLNGCTFIPRFDPAQTRRISLEKTRDEQYEDIHNEFRLGRIDSISHFTCDGDTIKKDGPTEINISYIEWENIADPVYLDGDTLRNSMGNEVKLKEFAEEEADNTVQVVLTDRQIRDRLTPESIEKLKLWPLDCEFKPGFMPLVLPPMFQSDTFSNLESAIERLRDLGNSVLHLKSEFRISKYTYKKKKYLYINFGLSIPFFIKTIAACMDAKDEKEENEIIKKAIEKMMDIILKALKKSEYFIGCKNGYSAEIIQIGYNTLILPIIAMSPKPEVLTQKMNLEDNTMTTSFSNDGVDLSMTLNILFAKMNLEDKFWIKADIVYEIEKFSRNYRYRRYKTKRK